MAVLTIVLVVVDYGGGWPGLEGGAGDGGRKGHRGRQAGHGSQATAQYRRHLLHVLVCCYCIGGGGLVSCAVTVTARLGAVGATGTC